MTDQTMVFVIQWKGEEKKKLSKLQNDGDIMIITPHEDMEILPTTYSIQESEEQPEEELEALLLNSETSSSPSSNRQLLPEERHTREVLDVPESSSSRVMIQLHDERIQTEL